jgi:hypothetical protein
MDCPILNAMSKAPTKANRKVETEPLKDMLTTAIHLRRDTWELLREVAFRRAQMSGGRTSVSELVRTLVESHREELERELKRHPLA